MINPESSTRVDERDRGLWGWFALVCYVPDPQKSFLNALRHSIPGKALAPVHITVLPPRPLRFQVNAACSQVEGVVKDFSAFEVELSDVRHFPETDFLYLNISGGECAVCEIHKRLNTGELEYPEIYEFRPHLTLGGPVPPYSLPAVQEHVSRQWKNSNCPRRVLINELVCLWLAPNTGKPWERYGSFLLKETNAHKAVAQANFMNRRY